MKLEPKTLTVIVTTLGRPGCVRKCLQCLVTHEPKPNQIIIVDASADDFTRQVASDFPDVLYLRHEKGPGNTTLGRNLGVLKAEGDVIGFLDDDAYVRPGWLNGILGGYVDSAVGAVGGRALRGQEGEEAEGISEIGLLTKNGSLTGNFAADPGRMLDVDHLIGCNMSFRREVLARSGGFREGFSVRYCLREESDIFLVMKRLGYRIVFNPKAVVDHVGAPKPKGQRFDIAYDFGYRNHYVLLVRNFSPIGIVVFRHLVISTGHIVIGFCKTVGRGFLRLGAGMGGSVVGLAVGTYYWLIQREFARTDRMGRNIRKALGSHRSICSIGNSGSLSKEFTERRGGVLSEGLDPAHESSAD